MACMGAEARGSPGTTGQIDREQIMKFAYWSREIAGWALILIGLCVCWNAYSMFLHKRILDGTPVMFMGFIVFRGGIHVLKVAVAAQAARMVPEVAKPVARRTPKTTTIPIGPTPLKSVLPGPKSGRPVASSRS
jgi:hypothetical protein